MAKCKALTGSAVKGLNPTHSHTRISGRITSKCLSFNLYVQYNAWHWTDTKSLECMFVCLCVCVSLSVFPRYLWSTVATAVFVKEVEIDSDSDDVRL